MGIACVMCNEGDDEWQCMIDNDWMVSESQVADYVVAENRERFVRRKMPLI